MAKKESDKAQLKEQIAAIHEAAHSVLSHLNGHKIEEVSIIPTKEKAAYIKTEITTFRRPQSKEDLSEKKEGRIFGEIEQYLGGMVASRMAYSDHIESNDFSDCEDDLEMIRELISLTGAEVSNEEIVKWYCPRTKQRLKDNWKAVCAVADALFEKKVIPGQEIVSIIEANMPQPQGRDSEK